MEPKDWLVLAGALLALVGVLISVFVAAYQQNKRFPSQNKVDDAATLQTLQNTINLQASIQLEQAQEDTRLRDKIVRLQADLSGLQHTRVGPFRATIDFMIDPQPRILRTDISVLATGTGPLLPHEKSKK